MSRWADLPSTIAMVISALAHWLRPLFKWALRGLGVMAAIMLVGAFTRVPFDAHRWLGSAAGECNAPAEVIVVLGGSGMPSGPELVRLYRAAELAALWPQARVVVIHPGNPSALNAMAEELRLRGVQQDRITRLNAGNNTREQALVLDGHFVKKPSIALVSSPENMYRTVLTFRKVHFTQACGVPAWDHAMFHNFDYGHGAVGGKAWVPDISGNPGLRYTFWNYLKLEVTCLREYVAIGYYWLNDWI